VNLKLLGIAAIALLPAHSNAQDLKFESDYAIQKGLGMFGDGDPLMKKQLGTGVGKSVKIDKLFVWSFDGSDWEKGGKLHLINDDSMGRQYRITCSLPPAMGDKFMADKKRRDIALSGKISSYSSSTGLLIDPCNATW